MLIININASQLLTIGLLTAHAGALAAAWTTSLDLRLLLLLGATLGASLWHSLALHATRRAARAVLRFELGDDGDCVLTRRNGETQATCHLQSGYATARLVVLQLRCSEQWWPLGLVLAADAVGKDEFHALRARLGMRRFAG